MNWCPERVGWPCSSIRPMRSCCSDDERRADGGQRAWGLQIEVFKPRTSREIDAAFAISWQSAPTRSWSARALFISRRVQLSTLATRDRFPRSYPLRDYCRGRRTDELWKRHADAYRQVGAYAGRILKGAKPADLPVVQSTKFELVINLKTAEGARPRRAADAARPRRRGDRMKTARVHHAARRRSGGVAARGARAAA